MAPAHSVGSRMLSPVQLPRIPYGCLQLHAGTLQELDLSAAMCNGGSLADGEALLAAAEASPALHTLT